MALRAPFGRCAAACVVALVLAAAPPRALASGCADGAAAESCAPPPRDQAAAPGAAPAAKLAAQPPAAPSTPPSAPPAGASEGERELALAREHLARGEAAGDDDGRRTAYEEAKRHADRAVELMPQSAEARFIQFGADGRLAQLGGIAVAAMNLVKLNKQLDEVLRLDPNHANALAARGGMLMKLPRLLGGNTSKGIEYLERSVAMDQTAIGKRLELAEAYHIVGREEDADATARQALEVAQKLDDPERVATVQRFIIELKNTCSGCAVATIGR
ncbi:MAG: hypothetical protein AB1689_24860 [Thermodesulfobacteriota bacterium]